VPQDHTGEAGAGGELAVSIAYWSDAKPGTSAAAGSDES
jgi:hypothetical protein